MTSSERTALPTVLPDSGADISAAGQTIVDMLRHHLDKLAPSEISPRAVNGTCMKPVGKIPVTISLQGWTCRDDMHIFPGVSGAFISWKAAKELGILPPHYPYPEGLPQVKQYPEVKSTKVMDNCNGKGEGLVKKFPSVFSGQISAMEGEHFKISLMENAQPFSVKTPRAVPFAYREKLRQELDSLQQQDIIAPVAQPTEWCADSGGPKERNR